MKQFLSLALGASLLYLSGCCCGAGGGSFYRGGYGDCGSCNSCPGGACGAAPGGFYQGAAATYPGGAVQAAAPGISPQVTGAPVAIQPAGTYYGAPVTASAPLNPLPTY